MSFLHGVEVIELDGGARPIKGVSSSIIGLVGTAVSGPLNQPVLIAGSRKKAVEMFGSPDGVSTIPDALDGIFDQTGAIVVVINVADPTTYLDDVAEADYTFADDQVTITSHFPVQMNVTDATGTDTYEMGTDYVFNSVTKIMTRVATGTIAENEAVKVSYKIANNSVVTAGDIQAGVQVLLSAENEVHVAPRILVAPGYSDQKSVADELVAVAERLRAVAIAEGPNTDDAAAITYRKDFGSSRLYMIDPAFKVYDAGTDSTVIQPASARVAGVIAKSDTERGFWFSPSNRPISGILGTARAVDFSLGDPASAANLLNENAVATVIRQDGYRLWGNRSCSSDAKWAFISVRRTADLINDALQRAHMWAVDRNITKTYVEDVAEGVNSYLRHLKSIGAIINGKCWADPELNTPDQIAQGKVTFDFDFVPQYPAEHITFRSSLNNKYLEEIFA